MVFSVALFLSVGAVFIALSVPLMRRRVKPNGLYGLRIRATFADEWVWYEANAKSGRDLFLLGLGIGLMAIALPLVSGIPVEGQVALLVGVSSLGCVLVAGIGIYRANRLSRMRPANASDRGTRACP